MENDSSMLVGSNSISSHEIEIVSPTPAVGQQQTSHQDTTVEDLTTAAMAWMLIRVVLIYAQLFLVGFVEQRSNNGLNLYVQPFCLAFPFYYPVCKRPYNGVILNLLVVLYPTFVTFVVVVVGAILSPVAVVFLPWLLVSFLLARLLQFIRHGDAYDNLVLLKFYIRTWIYYLYLYSVAPALAIFLAIAWSAPSLKNIFQDYRVLQLGYQQMTSITNALQGWEFICSGISFMLIMSTIFLILAFKFMPQVQLDLSESGINIPEAVLEIADCLNAFFCMTIILKKTNAPALKHHKILGLETWKWIQAIIFIVIIYNVITIFTRMSVWMLQRFVAHDKPGSQTTDTWTRRSSILQKIFRRRYLVYWGNGMKHSINFLLTSLLFLVAWLLYFRSHLKNTPIYWEFGIRTCLSFLACAFLWLIKSCVILSWEASSIYVRLQSKILQGGRQLYFLGIMGRHDYDIFNLLYHDEMPTRRENRGVLQLFSRVQHMFTFSLVLNLNTYFHRKTDPVDEWETEKKLSEKKNNRAKEFLLMQRDRTPTIYGIQQAALYFLMAKSKLVEEKYTSIILKKLETFNQADDDNRGGVERILKRLIGEENWNDFQHQLHQHMGPSESITFETRLQAWMVHT